ncbi:flavin monoamine oxidase family protein [Oceanobacillus jeddahense]|uniref:flavin monoamine oxidase family protein n=1 Tax=Oceanobacillus jeddahense TaxID=1462527 RepID=UPI0030B903AD
MIERNTQVKAIQIDKEDSMIVETELTDEKREEIFASAVILALPPRIIANHIEFSPSLSSRLHNALLDKATWMAGQSKAVAIYDRPFWRESGLSGFVSSRVGPLQEIHDASPEHGCGALFGFIGIPAKIRKELGENEIKEMIIDQLSRLFGDDAQNPETILYKDWSNDIETAVEDDWEPLRNFPIYGPEKIIGQWQDKLFFAGTESDSQFGGHLEGALRSAEKAVDEIINLKN